MPKGDALRMQTPSRAQQAEPHSRTASKAWQPCPKLLSSHLCSAWQSGGTPIERHLPCRGVCVPWHVHIATW